MAIYRQIYMTFWTDPKIDEDFTPEDKYFYLYLLTNPHTSLCGCYEIGYKQMARETGFSESKIKQLLERLITIHKVIDYDHETKEVLLINWHKHNWTVSPKLKVAIAEAISKTKTEHFREYLLTALESEDTVSIPYRYPMDTSVTVTVPVSNTVSVSNTVNTRDISNIHPTVNQVREYSTGANLDVDAERFVDYYQAQGWKLSNGRAMKDWKAACRNWARREAEKKANGTKGETAHEKLSRLAKEGALNDSR